jgi:4-aminobutyrate aminotransferase-like enzyme
MTAASSAGMVNAFVPGASDALSAAETRLVERRQRLLGSAYRLFYEHPVHLVRGEGTWLYDADGHAYLDVYNNVASVGHCHPHVVAALARQAGTLNTHTRYLHDSILDYAERLLATFPDALGRVMFTCTGSEANDLAMRVARHATGGEGIIVTALAYHGVTSAVAAFSPSLGRSVPLGPHVRTVPAPDGYRGEGDVGRAFADNVRAALADLNRHGIRPAALICDTVFSSDGVFTDPPGFLAEAVAVVREAGALFIADEVQPGFGRTGDAMWGFMRHGVVPDMVSVGKPMGNGYPVAGLIARPDLVDSFGRDTRYFNTFGGSPVACEVGMAVLDVIETEGLLARARDVGAHLRAGLRQLAERHDVIGDVRGTGQFTGVELVSDRAARTPDPAATGRVVNALRERRILISATGPHANILKIRPPLVFGRAEADILIGAMAEVLAGI